jgi:hypothetical protein
MADLTCEQTLAELHGLLGQPVAVAIVLGQRLVVGWVAGELPAGKDMIAAPEFSFDIGRPGPHDACSSRFRSSPRLRLPG